MSKVKLTQQKYDAELESHGQRRIYRCEFVLTSTGSTPVYREVIVKDIAQAFDRIPWWKRKKQRKQKS